MRDVTRALQTLKRLRSETTGDLAELLQLLERAALEDWELTRELLGVPAAVHELRRRDLQLAVLFGARGAGASDPWRLSTAGGEPVVRGDSLAKVLLVLRPRPTPYSGDPALAPEAAAPIQGPYSGD